MKTEDFFQIQKEMVVDQMAEDLRNAIKKVVKLDEVDFIVEHPDEEKNGDYFSNIALVLAGKLKRNPLKIAEEIAEKISKTGSKFVEKVEAVAPGFLNFYINPEYYQKELSKILSQKEKYGSFSTGKGKKIMVEFGQPNTHKAFHVGHLRSALTGLSVVKFFQNMGYAVIRANYYGDIGMHTAKCVWGMKQKGVPADFETMDQQQRMEYIDNAYVFASKEFEIDEKVAEEIKRINRDIYADKETADTRLNEKIKKWSLEHLDMMFADLGITYNRQYPESEVYEDAIAIVSKNAPVSQETTGQAGSLFTKSEGAVIYDGEKDGLTSWVFLTSEGIPTYSAKDLALAFKKFAEYDLDLNITLTSVEQIEYFKVIIKCLETLEPKFKNKYLHLPFGWLLQNNKKIRSREGGAVKGIDIIQEANKIAEEKIKDLKKYDSSERHKIARAVAMAGLKFLILSHEFHKNINYDPQKFINFEGYSGPYILYAFTRAKSILQRSHIKNENLEAKLPSSLNGLKSEYELKLLKWLSRYPQMTYRAGQEVAPHLLCVYLYELAQRFNQFYANCPVLTASDEEKQSRLSLTVATAQILKNGLALLGIETVEEM